MHGEILLPFGHGFITFLDVTLVNQSCLIFIFCFGASLQASAAASDFWEKTPELRKDLYEKRRILVSVTNVDQHTEFKGAGLVNAKFEKTWAFATNPAKIKNFAKDLDRFDWNLQTGECHAAFSVLWKTFSILAKTELRPKSEPPQIAFDFIEGSWIPSMKGQIEIKPHNSQSLVVMRARTPDGKYANWHFAMEAVLHRIAASLREAVEKD